MELSPTIVVAFELGLILSGLAMLWRFALSPAGRASAAAPALPKWGISVVDFLLLLWSAIMGGILGQFLTLALLKLAAGSATDDTRQIVATVGLQFGLLGGFLAGNSLLPGLRAVPAAPPRARAARPLLAGGAVFLAAMPLVAAVSFVWEYLLDVLGLPVEKQELMDLFANPGSPGLLATMILLAIVVAPITEELVFRAGLFRFARGRLPRWAALLAPAVLFGAVHGNLASFAPLAVLGLVFSLAYERTGDIRVSMVAHGLFNLCTALLIFSGADV
jgi:membrane protease YdiL (CAAX protease family)